MTVHIPAIVITIAKVLGIFGLGFVAGFLFRGHLEMLAVGRAFGWR